MARKWKIAIGVLAVAVIAGLVAFHSLRQRIQRLSQAQSVEEEARREVLALPITTPTDVTVAAKIFWAAGPDQVAPVTIQLPLSADPVQRAKQVLARADCFSPGGRAAHPARGCRTSRLLRPSGWHRHRRLLGCAGLRNSLRNFERGEGRRLDRSDTREQCAHPAPVKDSHSRAGGGNSGRSCGSHGLFRLDSARGPAAPRLHQIVPLKPPLARNRPEPPPCRPLRPHGRRRPPPHPPQSRERRAPSHRRQSHAIVDTSFPCSHTEHPHFGRRPDPMARR